MYTNIIHNDDICNYFLKNQQFIFNSLGNCRECRIQAFNLNEASLVDRRRVIINTILGPYEDLSDETIFEALSAEGFTSVVEQLLKERKQEEDSI